MAARPRLSPPPSSLGKGGAGVTPPPPTQLVSRGGGDTPDYILFPPSPRTRPRGTLAPPWKIPGSRFFTAAASLQRTTTRLASCGHTLAGPGWLRPRGPLQSCRCGQWRSYEWHDLPQLGSRRSHRAWTLGKTLLEGEAGRGCCTHASLSLSLELPKHSAANWLRDVAGCRFPMGLCGTLLPSD